MKYHLAPEEVPEIFKQTKAGDFSSVKLYFPLGNRSPSGGFIKRSLT
jgi:hypothetical protein